MWMKGARERKQHQCCITTVEKNSLFCDSGGVMVLKKGATGKY
jgi:hypothetical protein